MRTVPYRGILSSKDTSLSVFQHSLDFGLVQHVLTSDPTISIDLHEKYTPVLNFDGESIEYHQSLLELTRGIKIGMKPL